MSMENIAGARKPAKREDEHTVAGEQFARSDTKTSFNLSFAVFPDVFFLRKPSMNPIRFSPFNSHA